MTPAGRLDLSLDRALLLAACPACPTCGAEVGQWCRHARYDREIVRLHEARLADLRDEVEVYALMLATERAAVRQGMRAGLCLDVLRERLDAGRSADPRVRREARSSLARLRAAVLR